MSDNPIIYVFGELIEILVTSRSTNYTCCVGIQTSPPGGGPPPHKHEREEVTFTEIARGTVYLLADATFSTGTVFMADGGLSAS